MDAGAIGAAASDHLLAAGGEASEPPVMPAGQPSNQDLAADQRCNPCGAGGAALGLKERKGHPIFLLSSIFLFRFNFKRFRISRFLDNTLPVAFLLFSSADSPA
jgi:hypothetical protein